MKVLRPNETNECEILHFADGDTVFVRARCNHCGISQEKYVRLRGIESVEPYGESRLQAKGIAESLTLRFKNIKGELIAHQYGSDKYGRIIGTILIEGRSLAEIIVQLGMAWHHNHKSRA